MPRLFWKLFSALWLSIMGFMLLMAVVNHLWVQRNLPDDPATRIRQDTEMLEKRISGALQRGGPEAVRRALSQIPRQPRNRVFLFDAEGRELLGRERIRERLRNSKTHFESRTLRDRQGQAWELVVVQRPPPRALLEPGFRGVAWRLGMAAVISALVSFIIARWLAAPLEKLGAAGRRLAAGDLSARVGPPLTGRRDEFGKLAVDMDEMATRLQELQRANRRLLRDVSHELRSPLARLKVALELARKRDQGAVSGELDRIGLESERLESLVDEVLDLLRESSGASPLKLESFDLAELLGDLQGVVNYEAPKGSPGVSLESDGATAVTADRELLWRAFENLVRNAMAHTGEGNGVAVEVSDKGSRVEVLVRDAGPGVPPAQLDKIFEPFYRVQEARERDSGGYGLGLAIAQAAIRRHGGSISARNLEPAGLEIRVSLPALIEAA